MATLKNLTKWQNYVHYLLLTLGIIGLMHLNDIHYFHSSLTAFAVLYVTIFVLDTIIHIGFAMAPKPVQWKD